MIELKSKWFPFLNRSQFDELKKYFDDTPADFMVHQLAVSLGIEWSKGLAIITILYAQKVLDVKLLIYHSCDPELAVGAIPFRYGYPKLPFYCEECDCEIDDYSELDFDLMAKLN
jgi:hypothetical protein